MLKLAAGHTIYIYAKSKKKKVGGGASPEVDTAYQKAWSTILLLEDNRHTLVRLTILSLITQQTRLSAVTLHHTSDKKQDSEQNI